MRKLFRCKKFYLDYSGRVTAQWILTMDGRIIDYGEGEPPKNITYDELHVFRDGIGYPGFIDCHTHIIKYGFSLWWIDLRGVTSIEELKDRVRKGLNKRFKGWVLGRGWDQDKFVERRYPNRYDLDEVSNEYPIFLRRVCGHIAVANSKALELAGINRETPDPPGGIIDRDLDGEPTGILRENAMELVKKVIPQPTLNDYIEACRLAMDDVLSRGVTMVHLVSAEPIEWEALKSLRDRDELKIRVRVYFDYKYMDWIIKNGFKFMDGDDMLRFMGIKIITDGSLGGRTAALMNDYSDDPGNRGVLIISSEELYRIVRKAFERGYQLAIHGIGDRANRVITDVYIRLYNEIGRGERRDRIEHASILREDIIRDMARNNIYASIQPQFVTSDTWTVDRVGMERARWAYPFKTMINMGIRMGGGSDVPVEIPDPRLGIYAALTRGINEGNPLGRITNDERLSIEEALKLYTSGASELSYDEDKIGKLYKGYYMDAVILDKDLFSIDADEIRNVAVIATIVGGDVKYKKG